MKLARPILAAFAAAMWIAPGAAREHYRTSGRCDGFPRVALTTPAGLCVGLVVDNVGFLRGLAAAGADVYATDLASRTPGRGRVLRLPRLGAGPPAVVLDRLNQPNGIAAGRDGLLYVGEVGRIIRFDPRAADARATVTEVVTGLPVDGRHNLTAFTLLRDGALIVNIGSATDNCEGANGRAPSPSARCREFLSRPPRGALLRIDTRGRLPVPARLAPVHASGIRNAMAFAELPSGALFAAVNSRDNIDSADPRLSDAALPHDVLLRIVPGGDYGWPYCFDKQRPSPEYPHFDCRRFRAPALLL